MSDDAATAVTADPLSGTAHEPGVAKPDPIAFERALAQVGAEPGDAVHIGDIERTDVQGARAVGMRAVLYRNPEHRHEFAEDGTDADATMEHWDNVDSLLDRLLGSTTPT